MPAHQRRADLVLQLIDVLVVRVAGDVEQQFARQRIAIGVQAVRGQAEQDVAGLDGLAGDKPRAADHADDEAYQVVLRADIHAGKLRGFAAQQRATVGLAGIDDAADHPLHDLRIELAAGK